MILSALLCATSLPAHGADLEKAEAAYESGDYDTALQQLRPLAEQGDAGAQYSLGLMYDNGNGVPQDYKEALRWYRLAAEQGNAEAQYNLGLMYGNGNGVPQDYKEAARWFRLAAEQGSARAQHNLGVMYYNGHGVPQDYTYAHMWFNLGASNYVGEANIRDKMTSIRDEVASKMTPAQVEKAQELARECVRKEYRGC